MGNGMSEKYHQVFSERFKDRISAVCERLGAFILGKIDYSPNESEKPVERPHLAPTTYYHKPSGEERGTHKLIPPFGSEGNYLDE